MQKILAALAVASTCALAAPAAQASVAQSGTVYQITITGTGVVYFWQRGSRSAQPACSASFPGRWSFSTSTSAGQAMLALLLSANASGKPVVVAGKSVCDVAGDTETVDYVYIAD